MMETDNQCHVVIVAAGQGTRFGMRDGGPKQYQKIGKFSVLAHSIAAFDTLPVDEVVVVLHPQDRHWSAAEHPSRHSLRTTPGGAERLDSVLLGLQALDVAPNDWVLVHDAARPCVSAHDINCLMQACQDHQCGGLLAKRVTDTIKLSSTGNQVHKTLDREQLYAALTPQMFPYQALLHALETCDPKLTTDEASAMEQANHQPQLILGQTSNLKITNREDLTMARNILKQQGRL